MNQSPYEMKKYDHHFLLFLLVIIAMIVACKKNKNEDRSVNNLPTNKKWIVRTIAGDGVKGYADGPLLSARFSFPGGVSVANDGSIYVTDIINHRIRMVAGGQVSTIAGNSSAGINNGMGTTAQFISPYDIAVDANGNLYSTDDSDPRIRKTYPSTEVSVFAGTMLPGFTDGDADTARFGTGNYIAVDAVGNVYLSDALNNRIRKISVSGNVSTLAGSGVPGFREGDVMSAQFRSPAGIALDHKGNLFVADRGNHRIRKITPEGQISTFAGSGTTGNADGNAGVAQFTDDMRDMIIDGYGNLYISELDRIRKITTQGMVTTIAGSSAGYADGEGTSAKFNYPNGMGIDPQGNIYVADLNNNRIRKISFE